MCPDLGNSSLDRKEYTGLKFGILAAAAAGRGTPQPDEEDEAQLASLPPGAAETLGASPAGI